MIYVYITRDPKTKTQDSITDRDLVFRSSDYSILDHISKTLKFIEEYNNSSSSIDLYIYTDSDFAIRELSNIITLSQICEKDLTDEIKEFYQKDLHYINLSDIEVYGMSGNRLEVTKSGIICDDYNYMIDRQNELQGELIYLLFDKGANDS